MELQAALPYSDWAALRDDDVAAEIRTALEPVAGENLVTLMAGDATFQRAYHGVDGMIDAWRDWMGAFESYATTPEDVIERDDFVVLLVRQRAVPAGGGSAMENLGAAVFRFQAERLVRIEFHLDRDEALRAAGIEPGTLA